VFLRSMGSEPFSLTWLAMAQHQLLKAKARDVHICVFVCVCVCVYEMVEEEEEERENERVGMCSEKMGGGMY